MRSALLDRATGLASFHLHVDALRALIEERPALVVFLVSCGELGLVESLYGWQVLDRVLARAAGLLGSECADLLDPAAVLALNGVASEELLIFQPAPAGGAESASAGAERTARAIEKRLAEGFSDPAFASMTPHLSFRVSHATLRENPHFRFERIVYRALEQARSQHSRRETRRQEGLGLELRRVIQQRLIIPLYQPVVRLATGEVVGHEVFSRAGTAGPLEQPAFLFTLSERLGLSRELERVCRLAALSGLRAAGKVGRLFLNTRPLNMADPEWAGLPLRTALEEAGLSASDVVCEVPETSQTNDGFLRGASAVMREAEYLSEAAAAIRGAGFAVALDEAGTGRSSLELIESIRPDYLKIHRSLISGLDRSLLKQEVVASLRRAAQGAPTELVAVGVETAAERDALVALGIEHGQGWFFSRPLAAPLGSLACSDLAAPSIRDGVPPAAARDAGSPAAGEVPGAHALQAQSAPQGVTARPREDFPL
jgi:EAL domain-containing protein (putative c-di-GMP-specific phosphodiesterase class I)